MQQRGWTAGRGIAPRSSIHRFYGAATSGVWQREAALAQASPNTAGVSTWQPLGPTTVLTANYGLITGRVTAIALDPSDASGNHVYIGTTGGGVWMSNNAGVSTPASIVFSPLTDTVPALGGAFDASISIGAVTVQPGGTGVILAGTGDPNDVLDSYYGAGILRSTDGGTTWSLIQKTSDLEDSLSAIDVNFVGQGFAGFAWSTANPQIVVAAVSQAYEGTLVDADWSFESYEGLYYSNDSGATWHLARITDGSGGDVQGPNYAFASPGNAATAVVWNPVRQVFVAAVRFHGYYQSADGVTWTRLSSQPGSRLTTAKCPTDPGSTGSIACPIYRGALAVNPQNGDTFAWTVDVNNQDQGLWQDVCSLSSGACANATMTFATQWNTAALETNTTAGAATIVDGDYNLTLAAVPFGQTTIVLAGANDVWKTACPYSQGCSWRNTTNSTSCVSAGVAEYQHALAWNASNPLEIFLGNDGGLWRSTDAIGETGSVCASTDATHFQNLNGSLGSLSDVTSLPAYATSPYVLMAGLGVNGVAGVKNTATVSDWPQILTGFGGPVSIDSINSNNWYVNDQPGVSIYLCSQGAPCTPSAFGTSPVVTNADVGGDGDAMFAPAPFLVDPLDSTKLLVGTCRVWRGPSNGSSWTSSNAISPILDSGAKSGACNGDALIRSMAAMPLASGKEVIYIGMYGSADGGSGLPGHILRATFDPTASTMPAWTDLTLNPVSNDIRKLNSYGYGISSVTIDSHDSTGMTVYVTVAGLKSPLEDVEQVYRSTDGGATWCTIAAYLPNAPVNSLAVDPQNANIVYLATDLGVYFTTQVAGCALLNSSCWSVFGTGLPGAPVVALSTITTPSSVLLAATYGRGIWQTPLWSTSTGLTSATVTPSVLAFANQVYDSTSGATTVTLANTGTLPLLPTGLSITGDFNATDNCANQTIAVGGSCTIAVTFTPQATGSRSGVMTVYANIYGGQITVDLTGTGIAAGAVTLTPSTIGFGTVEVGATSAPMQVTVANSSASSVPVSSVSISPSFKIASNSCGISSLAADTDCSLQVEFAPVQSGAASGLLTFVDGAGTQTVVLTGTGAAPPADVLNPTSLSFPATAQGQASTVQTVTLTNSGGWPLTSIAITASAQFQQANNCTAQLAAGSVCTIGVQFVPTQTGTVTGTLTVSDILHAQTVALSGTGVTPASFSISPSSLTFTNQQVGVASAPQMLTIANAGGAAMANVGFAFSGAAASNYSVSATTCGATLAAGASCSAQIVFTPSATGAIMATLVVSSSTAGVSSASVPLNGSGQLAAGINVSPASVSFSTVGVGLTSAAQTVTITNSSSNAIGSIMLSIAVPFSIAQSTCASSLAAGASCTASLVFQPTATGAAAGTLTVTSTDIATPAMVALSGTGFDFTLSGPVPTGQSVTRGQQASYTMTIVPAGASATFAFACGTLPAKALCTFSPTSESLNAGVQGNVVVQISTSSGTTGRNETHGFWRATPLLCGLLLLPLAIRRQRRTLLLTALAAILLGGISSCTSSGGGSSGGSSGSGGGSGTPAGTYTIPVNVTSTGLTRSVNVSLTVD